MKLRARRDSFHKQAKMAFEGLGCSVLDLAREGDGCPDLLVGISALDQLVEVKSPGSYPSQNRKTAEGQAEFARLWRGRPVVTVKTLEDIGEVVRKMMRDGQIGRVI